MLWQQILNTKPTTSAQPLWQKIINNAGQSLTQGAGNVVPLWQKIRGFTREKIDQPIESKLSSFTGMPEQQVKKISEVGTMLYGSTAPLKITRTLPKLIQEAKGFKSADEFIKGNNKNPTVLFRGIKKNEGVQGRMGETWATSDFDTAQRYAGKDGKVIQIPKPDNIKGGYVIENNTRQFQGKIKPTGNEVVITHSQLKDIWNKAHKKPKYLNPKTIHLYRQCKIKKRNRPKNRRTCFNSS
jgi:hypothetical protein